MRKPLWIPAISRAGVVTLFAAALCAAQPPSAQPADGWVRRDAGSGCSVDVPAGWNVAVDARTGRATVTGPKGQQVRFWPGFIQGRALTAASAQTVLVQVSRTLDAALPWGRPAVQGSMARLEARTAQCNGVALLSWRPEGGGTALLAQAVEAPPAVYPSSLETFGRILGSFRSQAPAAPQAPAAASGALGFVRWTDPKEEAFSVDVPQGWSATGGLYRLSATDVRPNVRLLSPDHQVYVFVNDARLGAFIEPSPMLARFGLREGSLYQLADGSRLPVRRYQPGPQFAGNYASELIAKDFTGLRLTASGERPDLAAAYTQELRAEAEGIPGGNFSVVAGEASFVCAPRGSDDPQPWKGYLSAGTVLARGQANLWFVHRIFGYVAAPGRQDEAERVCRQAARTYATSPAWRRKEAQLCAQVVQQDNLRSQRLRSEAMAKIAQDQRETSDLIVNGYIRRSQIMDEVARKRENTILGTVDVVDPNTGDKYKVSHDSDVHWISDGGRIAGTSVAGNPGPGWTQMLTLP